MTHRLALVVEVGQLAEKHIDEDTQVVRVKILRRAFGREKEI
jgi:hypothetical protein